MTLEDRLALVIGRLVMENESLRAALEQQAGQQDPKEETEKAPE